MSVAVSVVLVARFFFVVPFFEDGDDGEEAEEGEEDEGDDEVDERPVRLRVDLVTGRSSSNDFGEGSLEGVYTGSES